MKNLKNAIKVIFPFDVPTIAVWTDKYSIINILKNIGKFENSNHIFYPRGGGLDLRNAQDSFEEKCIELRTSFNEIISIQSLSFHSFEDDENFDWAYFRINTNTIKQTNIYNYNVGYEEELTEIEPLNYIDRKYWDKDEFDNQPLPKGARLVVRRLKGDIVIFGKSSPYNQHTSTYDGRHDKLKADEFRSYISNVKKNGWQNDWKQFKKITS